MMTTQPSNHHQGRHGVDPFTSYSNYLSSSSSSQDLIKLNRMDADHHHHHHHYLSTKEVIRIAAARFFIKSSSSSPHDDISNMLTSYKTDDDDVSLSEEAMKMVDLVESLLAASHKVAHKDYHQAAALLSDCKRLCSSSNVGNAAIERLVFYFSEALQERIINLQITGTSSSCSSDSQIQRLASCLPMGVASQFAGVQAIIDEVSGAKRVHIIDLSIRNGAQWTILMSALASSTPRPPQLLLKITAVGTSTTDDENSRQTIEETGYRLARFAETLNLPFSFHVVMVPELSDLKVTMLGLHNVDYEDGDDDEEEEEEEEEAIAVYLDYVPRKLIRSPSEFDKLMMVIKSIDPSIMVVIEVEANHNSPAFGHRFMEALFFFNAYFDAIEACISSERGEAMYGCGGSMIRNIVACEGEERVVRNVPLRAWRLFFKRFGMVEVEMGSSCLEQAKGVIQNVVGCGGNLCTVQVDDDDEKKSLVVGWKGTRLHSVSAWKFDHQLE